MGQLVKVGLTAALFVLVGRTGKVAWLPMLATYAATLMMAVLVPAAVNRRARRT
jgi:F0F1-type ATP synthase assembly protein I